MASGALRPGKRLREKHMAWSKGAAYADYVRRTSRFHSPAATVAGALGAMLLAAGARDSRRLHGHRRARWGEPGLDPDFITGIGDLSPAWSIWAFREKV